MKIRVTQKHIKAGEPESCAACPIALAIREKGFSFVDVGSVWCRIGRLNEQTEAFQLPVEATHFVKEFDMGRPVQPFEFELDI